MAELSKIILGIETSCDETAAAVLKKQGDKIQILSSVVASSAVIQSKYGGIIPEQAAREQIKSIIPVIKEALAQAFTQPPASLLPPPIDAIAVTQGPGLIGSLLVGVETAKTLSLIWQKPLIPVNHLLGHFYANWIDQTSVFGNQLSVLKTNYRQHTTDNQTHASPFNLPVFPLIGLLVSGGHTDLVLFKSHNDFDYLGGTRDDAAGECFDKCARLLGLPYPGGPEISKLAKKGDPNAFSLPHPMLDSNDYDFSYSGLKTAVLNLVTLNPSFMSQGQSLANLCASIQQAIIDPLVKKTLKAAKQFGIKTIILGGGVAANDLLRSQLELYSKRYSPNAEIFVPQKFLCTDNAAMIASRAFFEKPLKSQDLLQASPSLSLSIGLTQNAI